jgi:alkaline phosphatase D
MNRRDFLKTLALAGISGPALLSGLGCAPDVIQADSSTGLSLGYVSGEVTSASAMIWLRADPGSGVALQYGSDPGFREYSSTSILRVDGAADYTAQISLNGLQPATRYYYRAAVAGKKTGPVASFVTAPKPEDDAKVTFCFSGDTRESYRPFTVMDAVRAQRPDFFLHLGDTIYADRNGTARELNQFWTKYRTNRSDAATQRCFQETPVYVVWDDHEVADDYLPGHPLEPVGRQAFLDYWPVRRGPAEKYGIYRSYRWGQAMEIFILDARSHRDPKKGTMLGKVQKEWLFEGIASSNALFKFIASAVPMAGGGSDRWDGYPKERTAMLRYINEKKIRGVVFLSADLHYAAITKIPKGGGLRDITAGPLGAPLNRVTNGTLRRFEYFLAENFNFAKITVDPKVEPGVAVLEFIDQDNRVFHTAKISAG